MYSMLMRVAVDECGLSKTASVCTHTDTHTHMHAHAHIMYRSVSIYLLGTVGMDIFYLA